MIAKEEDQCQGPEERLALPPWDAPRAVPTETSGLQWLHRPRCDDCCLLRRLGEQPLHCRQHAGNGGGYRARSSAIDSRFAHPGRTSATCPEKAALPSTISTA